MIAEGEPETTLADRVATAVLGVEGVSGLHGGSFGEVATYLPGRRVTGVRLREDGSDVHVTIGLGARVPDVATRVREAVGAVAPGSVEVVVEDVAAP